MRRILRSASALLMCALGAASLASAAPKPPRPSSSTASPPVGTVSVCNASGARPISVALTFTSAAPASAGGTQTATVGVGECSTQIFYPQGTPVIVTENVPAGYAVTAISIGGGGSTISSSSLAAGSATVTVGSGQSLLTFTTSGPAPTPAPRACKVPNVLGLGVKTAKSRLVKAACTLGRVTRAYSRAYPTGRVMAEKPRRGTVLAHAAPVNLVLSRGPRP